VKKLEVNQMQKIEGGDVYGCIGAYAAVGAVLAGAAAGPAGWAAVGLAFSGYGAGVAFGAECVAL